MTNESTAKNEDVLGAYATVGAKLVEQGYPALPVPPGQKRPGFLKRGEWQGLPDWNTEYTKRAVTRFEIEIWSKSAAGVGFVTGGKNNIVGIDVDTDDPAIIAAVMSALPLNTGTVAKKRGKKGVTVFARGTGIEAVSFNIGGNRVCDILADGRFCVLPPTQHPDTHEPYVWLTTDTFENTDPSDLPEITPEHIAAIGENLKPFGYEAPQEHAALEPCEYSGDGDGWRRLNEKALANLNKWVPDLGLQRYRRTATGYQAVATWRASGTGRPFEKRDFNLSMSGAGIRDFGDDRGYTAIDLVMAALDVDADSAFDWLEERIDPSPVVIALKPKVKPTMPATAKAPDVVYPDGWIRELSKRPPESTFDLSGYGGPVFNVIKTGDVCGLVDVDAVTEAELREAEAELRAEQGDNVIRPDADRAPPWHIIMPEPDLVLPAYESELERLTHGPGLVFRIVDAITTTNPSPSRPLALCAAVTVIGTLIGRRVAGPTRTGSHLYVIGLAPTGYGKQHPLSYTKRLLKSATASRHIGPSQFISMPAVINFLLREPLSLCVQDEFGAFLNASPQAGRVVSRRP